jgi:hypothetical protein
MFCSKDKYEALQSSGDYGGNYSIFVNENAIYFSGKISEKSMMELVETLKNLESKILYQRTFKTARQRRALF